MTDEFEYDDREPGLVLHAADPADRSRVLCGQIKMRDGSRRRGLRFTYNNADVTCFKCLASRRVHP
jgi:hypothetical protein